ncbi:hypothetical protein JKY79_00845 [Candidatus Babeliales bacterium]|nr:hypothetical protein [Candidatus Babeliales bacterium]
MFFIKIMLFLATFQILDLQAAENGWGISSWWGATATTEQKEEVSSGEENIESSKKNTEETSSLQVEDFEELDIISEGEKNWQQYFIESSDHNPLMPPAIRQKLITKGYNIIQKLVADKPIDHSAEVFTNAGRNFVEASWSQDIPTVQSLRKGMGKSFSWAHSFITNPINELEDTEALLKQRTTDRRAFLESIISVVWALADHAARLKYCKSDLIFTLKDPEKVLWNLISSYAEKCNDNATGFENIFAYPYSKPLDNSHAQQIIESWAIDARFKSTSWALPLLPYNNNMIVFTRMLPDKFNISPAKTIVATAYKAEGIASWIYKPSNIDIFSHQKSRNIHGKTVVDYVHNFLQAEGVKEDSIVLQEYYSPQMSKSILSMLQRIAQD